MPRSQIEGQKSAVTNPHPIAFSLGNRDVILASALAAAESDAATLSSFKWLPTRTVLCPAIPPSDCTYLEHAWPAWPANTPLAIERLASLEVFVDVIDSSWTRALSGFAGGNPGQAAHRWWHVVREREDDPVWAIQDGTKLLKELAILLRTRSLDDELIMLWIF